MAIAILLAIAVWVIMAFLDILIFWLFLRKIKYADKYIGFFCGNFLDYFICANAEEFMYRAYLLIFFLVKITVAVPGLNIAIDILGVLTAVFISWKFAKSHFTLEAPAIVSYYRVCRNFRKVFWDNLLNGRPISSFDKKGLRSIYSQIQLKARKDIKQNLFKAFFLLCFYFGIMASMLVLFFGLAGFFAAVIAHTLVNAVGFTIVLAPSDKKPFA